MAKDYVIDTSKIRKLVHESGLKDAYIAEHTGLTTMTINKIRRGKTDINHITLRTAVKLCKAYDNYLEDERTMYSKEIH